MPVKCLGFCLLWDFTRLMLIVSNSFAGWCFLSRSVHSRAGCRRSQPDRAFSDGSVSLYTCSGMQVKSLTLVCFSVVSSSISKTANISWL